MQYQLEPIDHFLFYQVYQQYVYEELLHLKHKFRCRYDLIEKKYLYKPGEPNNGNFGYTYTKLQNEKCNLNLYNVLSLTT